jgi:hypothetical protein
VLRTPRKRLELADSSRSEASINWQVESRFEGDREKHHLLRFRGKNVWQKKQKRPHLVIGARNVTTVTMKNRARPIFPAFSSRRKERFLKRLLSKTFQKVPFTFTKRNIRS